MICNAASAQKYPDPEFSNEVCFLKKDGDYSVTRLEKKTAKLLAKAKLGGLGGMESGYTIEDSRSTVRIARSNNLSFVFSTGATAKASSAQADSALLANGIDPEAMRSMMGNSNPLDNIALYKLESENGKRKILMQKFGAALPFASKKIKSSDKYTFSIKKIRESYWELVIDKPLPAGEYGFSVPNTNAGNMDGSNIIFAFGVD